MNFYDGMHLSFFVYWQLCSLFWISISHSLDCHIMCLFCTYIHNCLLMMSSWITMRVTVWGYSIFESGKTLPSVTQPLTDCTSIKGRSHSARHLMAMLEALMHCTGPCRMMPSGTMWYIWYRPEPSSAVHCVNTTHCADVTSRQCSEPCLSVS